MNLLRDLLLFVVLFAVHASACHGSQIPRTRGTGQQMGNMGMADMNNPKTDKELMEQFRDFKNSKWVDADVPEYKKLTSRQDLADKLKITKKELDQLADYAKRANPQDKDFIEVLDLVDKAEAQAKGK